MKKVSVYISDALHKRVKLYSVAHDTSLSAAVEAAISDYLAKHEPQTIVVDIPAKEVAKGLAAMMRGDMPGGQK